MKMRFIVGFFFESVGLGFTGVVAKYTFGFYAMLLSL